MKLKKMLAVLSLCCFAISSYAQTQNWDTLPWKAHADYQMQNLNKSFIATNILYDRMFPLANVDEYKGLPYNTNTDTTHPDHLMQAYYEMYNSAYNTTSMMPPDSLDARIKTNGNSNQHPIGIFLYKFNSLDSNALQDHLIDTLVNGQFTDVANRPRTPYFTNTSFLASPLLADGQVVEAGSHEFYLDPQFFLHNETLTIQSISVDFGDGTAPWVVNNPYGTAQARGGLAGIFKSLTKTILGRIIVVGVDILGQTIRYGSPFKVFVKNTKVYAPLTTCKGLGQQWIIEAPQARLAPINAQYGNPVLEYKNKYGNPVKDTAYFYFAGNGSTCNMNVLRRPIVFIDGFDPANDRDVKKIYEDFLNKTVERNGNPNTLFGDYMLNEGYDFVILDFKHGNDLLERNAMTLVSLIERLNQTYGSTMLQGITVIGPSMGSLIAQYALAYMEKNNIAHNVKTYISFDGCHQGANVAIGLQNYIEYFTKRGIFKKNKAIREGLYNGLAARQLLAHHVSANSNFPAPDALRTKFLQNLALVNEYPQLCRKVALINGTNTGLLNPNQGAGTNLLRIYTQRKGWKSLWGACRDKICMKLDWNCYTAPNNGTAKVMENWTVEPLFNLLFWVPLGKVNTYATAAWGNSSQDNAPGGTFGAFFGTEPGNINESNFVFLLKEAMYLLTGSKRTGFNQNINDFTMMPSYSAADLRFANKNLYMKWDDQYLCGKTPFDYVYAPPTNERHVVVSQQGAQYFENEVRCNIANLPFYINPTMAGNSTICTGSSVYSIETCKPNALNIVWTVTPATGVVNLMGSGNQATLTKVGNGVVTITATNTSACGNNFSFSKIITVGTPSQPQYINTIPDVCPQYGVNTNIIGGATYTWSFYKQPFSNNLQSFPNSGSNKKLNINTGTGTYNIGVTADNACGSSPIYFQSVYIDCGGGNHLLAVSPNPSTGEVSISIPSETRLTVSTSAKARHIQSKIYKVIVNDNAGNVVKTFSYPLGVTISKISLSTLVNGSYTLQVYDHVKWNSQKIILMR